MSVSIVLGFSAVLVLLCFLVRRYGRFVYLTSNIPGPSLWDFVFVHAKELLSDNLVYHVHKISMDYKHRPWGMWSMRGFLLVVSDSDSIGEVFKSKNLYSKPHLFYDQLIQYLARGLLTSNGKKNKEHHKLLAPAFRKTIVDTHLHQINIIAKDFTEKVRQVANGEDSDVRDLVQENVAKMAIEFFGEDKMPADEIRKVLSFVEEAMADVVIQSTNPVYYYLWHRFKPSVRARLKRVRWAENERDRLFFEAKPRVVARHFSDFAEKRKMTCVLDQLLELYRIGGKDVSTIDEEVLEEMTTVMSAAQDTTTFTMNICLVLVALHPEVQRRIFEEIDGIFGGSVRPVEHGDLAQLNYLELAIKEALRMFPPVPVIGREAEEDVIIGGVTVPKGCTVLINLLALHRNPEIYKDPQKYDPLRSYSPELYQGGNTYTYLPFSAGFRSCPGQLLAWMVLKTSLCYIFREFQVLPGAGVNPTDDIKPPMTFTFHCPKLPLRFVRRTK